MNIFFSSEIKQKLMPFFFENPDGAYHVRELASSLQLDAGNLSKELKALEKTSLFKGQKKGKYKVYTLNKDSEVYREFLKITKRETMLWNKGTPSMTHGKRILAGQIELICSYWDALDFTALCNTLIWAVTAGAINSIPIFSERVIVADDGIDAEHMSDITEGIIKSNNPFIKLGLNIFQFKKRDINAQVRATIISNLRNNLKGAMQNIFERTSRPVDNYVLFTNISLGNKDKAKLKNSILFGYEQRKPLVQIIGAGDIAPLINNIPHIRSSFFNPVGFSTWEKTLDKAKKADIYGAWVDLVGRQSELNTLKQFIDSKKTKAILIYGPQGMGKTRLALEATRHRYWDAIIVDDPAYFTNSALASFESQLRETIIIIDDPELSRIKELTREALSKDNIKLIITLPIANNSLLPKFGYDEKTVTFPVIPLTRDESEKLLKASGKPMNYSLSSWIIYNAGGNPGVLLAAANASKSLREESKDFIYAIGKHFEVKTIKIFGQNALRSLKLLSILTHVGISDNDAEEITLIVKILGDGLNLNAVLNEIDNLERAGIMRRKGSFVEISSPIFATYLAQQLLRGREGAILMLFSKLSDRARVRFLKRLGRLSPENIKAFWDTIFAEDGLFSNITTVKKNVEILRLSAGAVPGRTLAILKREILDLSLPDRINIKDDFRRDLVWTLEQLLFRKSTSLQALRIVGLLAEAENETWGNNASGVFCECFHPMHSQMPLSLADRFSVLKEFSDASKTVSMRQLVLRAINGALTRAGSHSLRESDGLEPFEGVPRMTYGEIWDYIDKISSLAISLSEDGNTQISDVAKDKLPHIISESIIQGVPEKGVEKLEKLYKKQVGNARMDVSNFASALNFTITVFRKRLTEKELTKDVETRFRNIVGRLLKVKEKLDGGEFGVRLKRWAGGWTRECDDSTEGVSHPQQRYQKELRLLAEQAVVSPEILTNTLIDWLTSEEAQKAYAFFLHLGELDKDRIWLPKLKELAKEERGAHPFSCYCAGVNKHSSKLINTEVETLHKAKTIHPLAILYATTSLSKGSRESVERVCELLEAGLLQPPLVERMLVCGKWIEPLGNDDFLRLLKALVGADFKYDSEAIDLVSMWIHLKKPLEGDVADFCWEMLEAARPISRRNDAWDYEQIASLLAKKNPDRGFNLAQKLLTADTKHDRWNPIDMYGECKFWNVLKEVDSSRALNLLLNISTSSPSHQFRIRWDLQGILDQLKDKELIIKIALEQREQAVILSQCISTRKPGFWPVAIPLIDKYISDKQVLANIENGIEQLGFSITGEYSNHLAKCNREVEGVLKNSKMPVKVRLWLQKISEKQKKAISVYETREQNERIDGFGSYRRQLDSDNQELKEWAAYKVLQSPDWEDAISHMNRTDILSALDKYDFSEERKKAIRKKLG